MNIMEYDEKIELLKKSLDKIMKYDINKINEIMHEIDKLQYKLNILENNINIIDNTNINIIDNTNNTHGMNKFINMYNFFMPYMIIYSNFLHD